VGKVETRLTSRCTQRYHQDVRTTLTLEEDVAAHLRAEMRRSGRSLKQTVNDCLRLGLHAARAPKPPRPFRIQARKLGLRVGVEYNNVWELLERLEGPRFK
jgi:hypothetical protein